MNAEDMTLARRLLMELYAAYYPSMYFKNLEAMSLKRSTRNASFSRAWLKHIHRLARPKVRDGFSKKSAFLESLFDICQPIREKELADFDQIPRPLCLDQIKERLLARDFSTLMRFLHALKKLVDQRQYFKKGTTPDKYLKQLDDMLEQFLLQHMHSYWLHVDDVRSSK
ncbi:uncharacterized protein LOC119091506 isoform X1 [Pollicipes pollicipes]|uniref:uncharacterized protein LOC119091506 isoform X1 n=1 Tax=Pollicipes pollicipes TaxID=41117 RepID=UPI001884D929|nr:uncharacterized protein LOC119091506 isoform X1 [Pollicipes pollicipes]